MGSKPEAWDICDDFLEPLAGLMYGSRLGWEDTIGGAGRAHEFRSWVGQSSQRFALVWLQVNVSCEVAELVRNKIEQAVNDAASNKWMAVGEIGVYFQDLSLVLRERVNGTIPKSAIPEDPLTQPLTETRLGKIFGCDPRNVQSMVLDIIEHKVAGRGNRRRYRLRIKDMPPGWEEDNPDTE